MTQLLPNPAAPRGATAARRARALATALLLALAAAPALGQVVPEGDDVSGRFLIAEPEMEDPNFNRTVIYMLDHGTPGALGLVVNRPLGRVSLDRLLELYDEPAGENGDEADGDREITVYAGGPVEPNRVFVLHSDDVLLPNSRRLEEGLAVTGSPEILRMLREDRGPSSTLVVFGYAGWGPAQLEQELERGAWDVVPFDSDLLFDTPSADRWRTARAARRLDL